MPHPSSGGGRPPLHTAGTPSRRSAAAEAAAASTSSSSAAAASSSSSPTATANPHSVPQHHQQHDAPSYPRTSSSGSLEPYDERRLRDADHSPYRRGSSEGRARGQEQSSLHPYPPPPLSPSLPSANTGHRRRRGGGAQASSGPIAPSPGRGEGNGPMLLRGGSSVGTGSGMGSRGADRDGGRDLASSSTNKRLRARASRRRPHPTPSSSSATNGAAARGPDSANAVSSAATSALAALSSLYPVLAALSVSLYDLTRTASATTVRAVASSARRTCRGCGRNRWVRRLVCSLGAAAVGFLVLVAVAARGFLAEARDVCTPPPGARGGGSAGAAAAAGGGTAGGTAAGAAATRPLVEYYVHGRGNGHYARSVAIIERLNDAGVDVRMFIGRATMWRAVNENVHLSSSRKEKGKEKDKGKGKGRRGRIGGSNGYGGGDADGSGSVGSTGPSEATAAGKEERAAEEPGKSGGGGRARGVTTAISVTSITPSMDLFAALSHILERVVGDCEVARQTERYPDLVVSDGDVPGMLRAYFGSVPSVGISHGQTFAIGVQPQWVRDDDRLRGAWERQRSLNWRAAFLTDWQIGTSFVGMETRSETGVIAMSPMRPEALGMARERWRRRRLGGAGEVWGEGDGDRDGRQWRRQSQPEDSAPGSGQRPSAEAANVTDASAAASPAAMTAAEAATAVAAGTGGGFLTPAQRSKIDSLLLGDSDTIPSAPPPPSRRRKLVICYFRDKNGDVLLNALLRSGFDVLLFERGYHKGLMNIRGVEKFGHKYIVRRDKLGKVEGGDRDGNGETEEPGAGASLDDYWREMLIKANADAKVLTDAVAEHMRSGDGGAARNPSRSARRDGSRGSSEDDREDEWPQGESRGGLRLAPMVDDLGGTTAAGSDRRNAAVEEIGGGAPPSFPSDPPAPRIIRVTDMSLFVPLMSIADGVASSAGSQLISECMYSGTPILSLYRESDDEQMLNVMMYRHMVGGNSAGGGGRKHPSSSDARTDGDSATGGRSSANCDAGKVVHGISLEAFSEAFSFLSAGRDSTDGSARAGPVAMLRGSSSAVLPSAAATVVGGSNVLGISGGGSVGAAAKLLTEEQNFLLLRSGAKRAHTEFAQFVEAVVKSTVSSSYYDELLRRDASASNNNEGWPAASEAERGDGWADPFRGMPDAAPVILEILKQIVTDA